MEHEAHAERLSALGQPTRLAVFRLLSRRAPGGVPATEIADALGVAPNTLSAHLDILTRNGLIRRERQNRSLLYRLDIEGAAALIGYLAADCCRGRPDVCGPVVERTLAPGTPSAANLNDPADGPPTIGPPTMDPSRGPRGLVARPLAVLFVCTGNSARSIFAEAILNRLGAGRFVAYSAGTRAYSELNPHAVALLEGHGYDVTGLRAKHVSEFRGATAPALDFVFTVCDRSANEECPPWPGRPMSAHWGVPDPVKAEGTDAEKAQAFDEAFRMLHRRISAFAALPVDALDRIALQHRLDGIALGATAPAAAGG
ncbi:MAG: metalloregulator ArsR/SmtB family transcription factor [Alphaproteobacteria bacterium]